MRQVAAQPRPLRAAGFLGAAALSIGLAIGCIWWGATRGWIGEMRPLDAHGENAIDVGGRQRYIIWSTVTVPDNSSATLLSPARDALGVAWNGQGRRTTTRHNGMPLQAIGVFETSNAGRCTLAFNEIPSEATLLLSTVSHARSFAWHAVGVLTAVVAAILAWRAFGTNRP